MAPDLVFQLKHFGVEVGQAGFQLGDHFFTSIDPFYERRQAGPVTDEIEPLPFIKRALS